MKKQKYKPEASTLKIIYADFGGILRFFCKLFPKYQM